VGNYRVSTNTNNNSNKTTEDKTNKNKEKSYQLRLLIFKPEFLKTSVDLETECAVETHRPEV
jgi:hypothetical protein